MDDVFIDMTTLALLSYDDIHTFIINFADEAEIRSFLSYRYKNDRTVKSQRSVHRSQIRPAPVSCRTPT